jgi:hypothetical protein
MLHNCQLLQMLMAHTACQYNTYLRLHTQPYTTSVQAAVAARLFGTASSGSSAVNGSATIGSLQLRGPQQQQLQAQMAEEAINQQIIEETEAELGAINKSLHTVHEIFKDLASMVSQQQEQVCILHT